MFDAETLDFLFSGTWGRVAAFFWGAVWGSFFNVLIVRLPAGESVVRPASHCRGCKRTIAWYDNVPLLSYLLLRGQCRHCGEKFSARYFLTELLICLLTMLMHHMFVVNGTGDIGLRLAQFVTTSGFCGILISLAFIDLDTMRIPDAVTYPGIPIAMALSLLMQHSRWWDGLVGGVVGYLVIRAIADGYQLLTGRMGMGYGDAKLLAMVGGLLGWQALLPTLFLASFQGSVIGIAVLAIAKRRREGAQDPDSAPDAEPDSAPDADPDSAPDAEPDSAPEPEPSAEMESEAEAEPVSNPVTEPGLDAAVESSSTPASGADDEQDEDDPDEPDDSIRYARIPFGPFLTLAALEVLVLGDLLARLIPFPW